MISPLAQAASILAAGLNMLGWFAYIRSQLRGLSRSSPANWLSSLLLVSCAFVAQARASSIYQSMLYAAGIAACLTAFMLSLRSRWVFEGSDVFLLSLSAILLYMLLRRPAFAIGVIATYYLANYTLFVRNIALGYAQERPLPWAIWMAAALAMLVSLRGAHWDALVLPGTNLLCWAAVFLVASRQAKGEPANAAHSRSQARGS